MSGFVRLNKKVGGAKATSAAAATSAPQLPVLNTTPQTGSNVSTQETVPLKGTGGSMTQPVQLNNETKSQHKLLQKVAATAQIRIPNGCKPWVASQFLTTTGVKDVDTLLSGGIPLHTLNTVVTDVRTRFADNFEKIYLWEGHLRKQRCIHISTRSNDASLYFAQQLLKPALVAESDKAKEMAEVNNNNNNNTTSTTTTTKKTTTKPQVGSIDDDDLSSLTTTKTKPITQGSVASALNNDAKSKNLTIAWQYDKYANKTMDDSNLSGVNDDDIDDQQRDEENDEEIDINKIKQNEPSTTNKTKTQQTIATYKDKYDYHIITPTMITLPSTDMSNTPLLALLTQTKEIISNNTIASCHLDDTTSATNNNTTDKSALLIPNRIALELTAEMIYPQQQQQQQNKQNSSVSDLLANFFTTPINTTPNTTTTQNVKKDITIAQFLYSLYSIAMSTNTVIFVFAPPSALPPHVHTLLNNLSQFMCSLVSFQSQIALSGLTSSNNTQVSSAAMLFSDKHDGLFTIHKFPRLNTPTYSYKLPDSTLFLFRNKKQLTATLQSSSTTTIPTIGVTKLVLPPEISRSGDAHNNTQTGGGAGNKDLFAEAIQDMTQTALQSQQQQQQLQDGDNNNKNANKNTAFDKLIKKQCPTCGRDDAAPQNPLTPGRSSPGSSMFGSLGSFKSKTQHEQQQIQSKQNDMAILEEEEEEDGPE